MGRPVEGSHPPQVEGMGGESTVVTGSNLACPVQGEGRAQTVAAARAGSDPQPSPEDGHAFAHTEQTVPGHPDVGDGASACVGDFNF